VARRCAAAASTSMASQTNVQQRLGHPGKNGSSCKFVQAGLPDKWILFFLAWLGRRTLRALLDFDEMSSLLARCLDYPVGNDAMQIL
jgi:hypothetical protein